MSYTTNRQPEGISKDTETLLREGMIAEIVAINDYSCFINLTDNKSVKEIFNNIIKDEKRHYGLFLNALKSIDTEELDISKEVKTNVNIPRKDYSRYNDYSIKGVKGNLLTHIRNAIKGELEAIVLYNYLIDNLNNKNIVNIINDIRKDEKYHVEELTVALILLDNENYGPLEIDK